MKFKADALVGFILCHAVALLVFVPYFFSWSGVAILLIGVNVFGVLGLNVGFHRLLTHRGFSCPLWLERTLAILGTCCLEFSPPLWVAVHRRHHHHSDGDLDPHSPFKGFFWAHFGWLLARTGDMKSKPLIERYARDLMRDPLYAWLEHRKRWILVSFAVWALLFFLGLVVGLVAYDSSANALQLGLSWVVWGGAVRTVVVWHITWSVNSAAHVWGYQNYSTGDASRNNAFVAIISAGEGWHNNHHADPTSARHGHRWWELDFSYFLIRLLESVGLAWNVATPSPVLQPAKASHEWSISVSEYAARGRSAQITEAVRNVYAQTRTTLTEANARTSKTALFLAGIFLLVVAMLGHLGTSPLRIATICIGAITTIVGAYFLAVVANPRRGVRLLSYQLFALVFGVMFVAVGLFFLSI